MIQLFLIVVLAASQLNAMKTMTKMEQLANDLTTHHLPHVAPGKDMTIKTKMHVLCVDKDMFNPDMMTVKMLETYMWTDNRMKWNPTEYDGIKKIHLPTKMVWTPDMTVYDADHEMLHRDEVNVIITHTGVMAWMPTTTYRMRCSTHTTKMTSTTTNDMCQFTIGSASMDDGMMKMNEDGIMLDTTMYGTKCPMKITNPVVKVETKTYPCCEGTYSTLKMTMTINMNM
jgi:hypothetical protein